MVDLVTGVFSFALAETMKVVRQALQMGSSMAAEKPAGPAPARRTLEYYVAASSLAPHPPSVSATSSTAPHPVSPAPEHAAEQARHPVAGFRVDALSPPGIAPPSAATHTPAPPTAMFDAAPAQAPGWGPMP